LLLSAKLNTTQAIEKIKEEIKNCNEVICSSSLSKLPTRRGKVIRSANILSAKIARAINTLQHNLNGDGFA
jgi:hypothetical protein